MRTQKCTDWHCNLFIYRVFLGKDHCPEEIQNLLRKDNKFHHSFAIGSGNADANGQNKWKP